MPAHSARVLKGMSIGYATATRGGSHHDTRPTLQYATDHDNTTPEGKPEFAVKNQHFTAVGDALSHAASSVSAVLVVCSTTTTHA